MQEPNSPDLPLGTDVGPLYERNHPDFPTGPGIGTITLAPNPNYPGFPPWADKCTACGLERKDLPPDADRGYIDDMGHWRCREEKCIKERTKAFNAIGRYYDNLGADITAEALGKTRETVAVSMTLPAAEFARLAQLCEEETKTMSQVVRAALAAYPGSQPVE